MSFRSESENYKYWTIQEDEKLMKLVKLNIPLKEIAKIMNRSYSSCASHSSLLGLKNDYTGPKKHSVNENFWDEPNFLNCYYAGILAADGCLQLSGKQRPYVGSLSWEVGKDDVILLEGFKKNTDYSGNIQEIGIRVKKKGNGTRKINIHSQRWNKNLIEKFNIVPKKTFRTYPPNNLSEQLLFCWLIGYIDGDGTVHYHTGNDSLLIRITSSSKNLINFVYEFLKEKFPQKFRNKAFSIPRKIKHANCYEINILGIRAICLYDYLKHYNLPKLERKWNQEKVNNLVSKYKSKYPHFFDFSRLPEPVK